MTDAPRTFADWLPLLDRFRGGDDAALEPMLQGSIEWTAVVAERWTTHVTSALEARLKGVSCRLQVGLSRSGGDSFALSRALLDARRALQPLFSFASLPCLPDNVGRHLRGELERWARETQEAMEKSAREIRSDNGRLLKIIRDSPLAAPPPASTPAEAGAEPFPRGRRVIL